MRMKSWWVVAAAMAVAVPDAGAAQARVARDTGLIVGSVESAIRQPARRMENFGLIVDLSDRRLYVMSGDDVVQTFPVSIGEEDYATPAGNFTIRRMIWNPSWTPPRSAWARDKKYEGPGSPGNPMGRVKMFFREPDYYIHGTGLASSLGNARSHGCLRMRNIDAVQLARIVMINGGGTQDQAWYEQTIANPTTLREVNLPRPVTIRVRA
ncbi:MAG TPA: L,D-transpeptidase family protein [Longimicrobium sp.]|nr:L,D-transpeptidase family protein [Longimicrobium sp.]